MKNQLVDYRSDDFNVTDFPLGYVNFHEHASYLYRVPCRRNKQGVSRDNTVSTNPHINFRNFYVDKCMHNLYHGKYPTLAKALARVMNDDNDCRSMAFNRYMAVAYDESLDRFTLMHKGEVLAIFDPYKRSLEVLPGTKSVNYVNKTLQQYGINPYNIPFPTTE